MTIGEHAPVHLPFNHHHPSMRTNAGSTMVAVVSPKTSPSASSSRSNHRFVFGVADAWGRVDSSPAISAPVYRFEMFFFIFFKKCLQTFKNHNKL
jgi:hypothetical protein